MWEFAILNELRGRGNEARGELEVVLNQVFRMEILT